MAEGAEVKDAVNRAFPNRRSGSLDALIDSAVEDGQFSKAFPMPFVSGIINLLVGHIDTLIRPNMSQDDIAALTDNLVDMLKHGLKAQ